MFNHVINEDFSVIVKLISSRLFIIRSFLKAMVIVSFLLDDDVVQALYFYDDILEVFDLSFLLVFNYCS